MPDELTSPSAPATGEPGPATGQNATVGATPAAATLTLEEALKRIADYEHAQKNATEEVERHRKKLTAYEKAEAEREAAKKAADEAQLSEIDRVKKQHAEVQAQHNALMLELQETRIQHAVERAAHDLGFLHPEIAGRLLDRAELEYEDNGAPKNAKHLLEKLLKSMPELAKQAEPAQPSGTSQQGNAPTTPTRPGTPALPAFNPGRTQITPPGTPPPGQRITLADIRNRRS